MEIRLVQGEIPSQEGQLLVTTWSEFEELEFKMGIEFEGAYKQFASETKQKFFVLEPPILKQKSCSEVKDWKRARKNK